MKAIPVSSRSIRSRHMFWLSVVLSLLFVACAQAPTPTPVPAPTKAPAPQAPAATAAAKPTVAPTEPAAKPTAAPTQPAAAKPAESGAKPGDSAAKTAAQPKALQKVRLNVTGTISEAPHYIAMEKGWMKEGGIEVEIASLASAADVMPALSAGQLDVVAGGINIGTFNAVARNVPLTVVANQAFLTPGNDGNVLLVRPDLANEVKSIRDLKGRKVAINTTTSPIVYMLGKMLEKNGMKLSDVEVVTIGFPDMITALANKAIDAAVEVEPFAARAEEMGVGKELAVVSQVIGPMEVGVVFFNADWAKKNSDLAVNYVTAFLKGSRQYYEAMKRGPNRADVVGILTKYTSIKDAALYEKVRWTGLNPDGYMDAASIQDQIDWYFNNKLIDQKVPVDKVINHTYLDEAIKKVGKYNR